MLIIRKAQMTALRASALTRFERQLTEHALKFAPRHAASLGDQQLQLCVHTAVSRARMRGFTLRGPVRLWVELTFMFGIEFDTDPQLHSFVNLLSRPSTPNYSDQLSRADNLRMGAVDFTERIAGSDGGRERAAVERVSGLSIDDLSIRSEEDMIALLRRIHPEKVDAAGKSALQRIIKKARSLSETRVLDPQAGPMAITLLMFAFGHGCIADPLFPWIAESLSLSELDARARLKRLHRKALRFVSTGSVGG
jgi:hypothetical protein